jgi:hypothetical protein
MSLLISSIVHPLDNLRYIMPGILRGAKNIKE